MHLRCASRRMKMGHTVRRTKSNVRRTFPQAAIFKGAGGQVLCVRVVFREEGGFGRRSKIGALSLEKLTHPIVNSSHVTAA